MPPPRACQLPQKPISGWGWGPPKLVPAVQHLPPPASAGFSTCGLWDRRALFPLHPPHPNECCPCWAPGTPGPTLHQQLGSTPRLAAAGPWHSHRDDGQSAPSPVGSSGLLSAKTHKTVLLRGKNCIINSTNEAPVPGVATPAADDALAGAARDKPVPLGSVFLLPDVKALRPTREAEAPAQSCPN